MFSADICRGNMLQPIDLPLAINPPKHPTSWIIYCPFSLNFPFLTSWPSPTHLHSSFQFPHHFSHNWNLPVPPDHCQIVSCKGPAFVPVCLTWLFLELWPLPDALGITPCQPATLHVCKLLSQHMWVCKCESHVSMHLCPPCPWSKN